MKREAVGYFRLRYPASRPPGHSIGLRFAKVRNAKRCVVVRFARHFQRSDPTQREEALVISEFGWVAHRQHGAPAGMALAAFSGFLRRKGEHELSTGPMATIRPEPITVRGRLALHAPGPPTPSLPLGSSFLNGLPWRWFFRDAIPTSQTRAGVRGAAFILFLPVALLGCTATSLSPDGAASPDLSFVFPSGCHDGIKDGDESDTDAADPALPAALERAAEWPAIARVASASIDRVRIPVARMA